MITTLPFGNKYFIMSRVHKIDIVAIHIHNVKDGNSCHACSISLVASEM